jgi:hypothetical protein
MNCRIYIGFDLSFTQENIRFIIQRAEDLGIVYLADAGDRKVFNISSWYFNIDEAILKLLIMTNKTIDYEKPFLHAKYFDTDFSFWLYEGKNKLITLEIGAFGARWDKKISIGRRTDIIDFSRYIRFVLNICVDIPLLKLETYSDLEKSIEYNNQNCVTALIDMGSFKEQFSGSLEGIRGSCSGLIDNGLWSEFIFFDENVVQSIEPSVQRLYDILQAGFPAFLYAKKDDISFKIEIKQNVQGYDRVTIHPLEPYLMKKGYGSKDEKIDVAFYVQRLIELCENFAIYELKTFF